VGVTFWSRSVQPAFLPCLLLALLGGCATLPPLPPPAPRPAPLVPAPSEADTDYTIGPEDVLKITVYGHEDLSAETFVSPDGAFSYPLLGEVRAAGLTARQLEKRLTTGLAEYLVKPQVSVTIRQFQSQQVYVVGEVKAPGTYVLKHASTLLEVLSQAGGPTPNAGWEVVVVRKPARATAATSGSGAAAMSAGETKLQIDLEKLLAGHLDQPITVQGGDTIYLPPATFFYVSGQVARPGRYRLERDTTVTKALAAAGGMTRFAAKTRLKVRRLIDAQRREFQARMTDVLQADDVLIVPESVF
jgi:polysaccharide export outer membrane protein